jgi:biopolymer transport protein ExbB/TolQ
MKNLFFEGGPLFMGILTVVLIIMVAWAVYHFLPVLLKKEADSVKSKSRLKHIKTIGTFALITGILGQLIGLISAFDAIEQAGGVQQGLLAGGLKVSTIPTIYGILIYMISLMVWFVVDNILTKSTE